MILPAFGPKIFQIPSARMIGSPLPVRCGEAGGSTLAGSGCVLIVLA